MIELLAPVGSKEAFYAAIHNHADAVYLGGKQFGARAYANNFSNDEIKTMISEAHLFDVKVYVTVNTIIYDDEIEELIEFLDFLYLNGSDAIIVQDLGVANIVRHRYPEFDLHASTQMNIHSIEQVKLLKDLGFKRVVLARELSIEEISDIKKAVDIEVEVFVHGALCVSCSGNCYFSSLVGKRSGNRGRCAQPCRLLYSQNNDSGYLLSPKDLNSLERVNLLIEAGIDSLKIEGRMKRPEYVAQIVQSYRGAINSYFDHTPFDFEKNQKELEKIFNRGFTKGFLFHEDNDNFINKEYSNHIGIEVGRVVFSNNDYVLIKLNDQVQKGDSLRIVGREIDAITINQMYVGKRLVEKAVSGTTIRLRAHKGNLDKGIVFLTTSNKQINNLQTSHLTKMRKIKLSGRVFLENEYLSLVVSDGKNFVQVKSPKPVEPAKNFPSNDRILDQINKTANTDFEFTNLKLDIDKPIFISVKEINELRRQALVKFAAVKSKWHYQRKIQSFVFEASPARKPTPRMKVKVRNQEQLQAVLNYPVTDIYVTDKDLLNYQSQFPEIKFAYVTGRIMKEEFSQDLLPTKIVSSTLRKFRGANTSIYLNIANIYAINLLERLQANSVGLSLEMSFNQIKNLVDEYQKSFISSPNLEMMVYGRYELMIMKYQLDRSRGDKLKDRKGFEFPIIVDNDGYLRILNSKKIHLYEYLREIYCLGISVILDFTIETYQEVIDVCDIYFYHIEKQLEDVTYGHFKEGVL